MTDSQIPEDYEKIHFDLPNHWFMTGESIWAKRLAANEYQIKNVPYCAYGVAFDDVVFAESANPDLKPAAKRVLRPSGHRVARLYFCDENLSDDKRKTYFDQLAPLMVTYERAFPNYYALDIEPEADYETVLKKLNEWERDGIVGFETGEARVLNSFDDTPAQGTGA